jgi:hypothetical protein
MDITSQLDEVKARTRDDAIERGILQEANENARRIVRELLLMAGFTEVVFAERQRDTDADESGGLEG